MKVVAVLNIDEGWIDEPTVRPAYIFNNIKDLLDYFSNLGEVEIIEEPNPNNIYDFGMVKLCLENITFNFSCMYAENIK